VLRILLSVIHSSEYKMTHRIFNCVTLVFNVSEKILCPCSVRSCNGTNLWKRVEVRFFTGVAEVPSDTDRRERHCNSDISLKLESSSKQDEESRLLKIAIIGVPNVGKSTIINQLVGRKVNINKSPILMCV